MMRSSALIVTLFCCIALVGCSRSALPVGPTGTSEAYPLVDLSSIGLPSLRSLSGKVNASQVSAVKGPLGITRRRPQSAFGGGYNAGHGQDGFFIQAPSFDEDHSSFVMVHSVWVPGSDVVLNTPSADGNAYYLYAPTTHPPNSCIEAGTAYMSFPSEGNTQSYVYFYDFCKNGGTFSWFLNDARFRSTYVFRDAGTNAPSIAIIITTLNSSPSTPDWSVFVWNAASRRWDLFYVSTYENRNSDPPQYGWSIFEPNFQSQPNAQPCRQPRMPRFSADYLEFYNVTNGNAFPLSGHDASRTTIGACVSADASGAASFKFITDASDYRWEETATGH